MAWAALSSALEPLTPLGCRHATNFENTPLLAEGFLGLPTMDPDRSVSDFEVLAAVGVAAVEALTEAGGLLAEVFEPLVGAGWLLAEVLGLLVEAVVLPSEPPHAVSTRLASTIASAAVAGVHLSMRDMVSPSLVGLDRQAGAPPRRCACRSIGTVRSRRTVTSIVVQWRRFRAVAGVAARKRTERMFLLLQATLVVGA